ncbi:DnaJ domain-containing protein [Sulfurospirillum arcachonense]|uniref:DnaJ domain-containing protein n=1 Tax=Sulfurospirillum arcachonense TaxID=57666 RepID=UPI00046A9A38|nr:DnaJ domain-containing protein [Sulfurospirillum arcachonense]
MSWSIFIAVAIVFYLLTRGYKTSDYQNIHVNKVQRLQGKLEDHEAGLLVALMAKVAKADGKVCELEAELLSLTFTDISKVFDNPNEIREELKAIYKKEMKSFENTLIVSKKYFELTKRDYAKRLKVMEYLLNLAFIDHDFSKAEFMITEDIANALEIKKSDFETLIAQFEQFYARVQTQKKLTLSKAYEILGVSEGSDFAIVKKEYRKLVREHHPDILMGQGKEQSIIDEATKKLQEINEAYELIKNNKK